MTLSKSASSSVYDTCKVITDANNASQAEQYDAMLQCVGDSNANSIDVFFLIYASSLVFFMQAGFAMLCAGSVQLKNVQNSMLKNLLDACGAALGFYSIGYAFAYGGSDFDDPTKTFIGTENFFLIGVEDLMFWLFQFAFAASAATIVAGTLAERCQMAAYLCYSLALTGFVYPVVVHSVWSPQGFLSADAVNPLWGVGVIDFAGSLVVHLTGGSTALIATYLLGPRRGRFYDHRGEPLQTPKEFPGHSSALQVLGALILWFGWYGFNTGSALSITGPNQAEIVSLVAVNTTLAAASAAIAALFVNYYAEDRKLGEGSFSLRTAMNGTLSGLVSITGGCAVIEPWAAVVIGFTAGILYLCTSKLLVRMRIDDVVDAVPVHCSSGIWGTLAIGFFASSKRMAAAYGSGKDVGVFMGGNGTLLGCQAVGILFVIGWVATIMFPFFCLLHYLGWLRSDPVDEVEGLDYCYHKTTNDSVHEEEEHEMPMNETMDSSIPPTRYGEGNRRLRHSIEEHERRNRISLERVENNYGEGNRRLMRSLEEHRRRNRMSSLSVESLEGPGLDGPVVKQPSHESFADNQVQ